MPQTTLSKFAFFAAVIFALAAAVLGGLLFLHSGEGGDTTIDLFGREGFVRVKPILLVALALAIVSFTTGVVARRGVRRG